MNSARLRSLGRLLLFAFVPFTGLVAASATRGAEGDSPHVRELLEQRLGVLREMVKIAEARLEAQGGSETLRQLFDARVVVAFAEVELASDGAGLLAALERAVAAAREYEATVLKVFAAVIARPGDPEQAKLMRLDLEIALAREKQRQGR